MDTILWALFLGLVVIAWLGASVGLFITGMVKFDAGWSAVKASFVGLLGALIFVFPIAYYVVAPKTSTLLDDGCYHVGREAHTTYVMSGKVLVPATTYTNTFVQFVCPE